MDKIIGYKYYDSPEGQDIFFKTVALSKYAAITGVGMAAFDVLMFSKPKGILNSAGRFAHFIGPLVGAATAFVVTSNVSQNIRGKNDKLNYFIGGSVSGLILSAWQKAPVMAVPLAVICGCAGMIKKTAHDAGYEFFPNIPHMTKTIQSVRHDWTMAKDVESLKNWTTGSGN